MKLIIIVVLINLLFACNQKPFYGAPTMAFHLGLSDIFNIENKELRDNEDSCLYFLKLVEQNDYRQASSLLPFVEEYNLFEINYEGKNDRLAIRIKKFPFEEYNSLELLCYGQYLYSKYKKTSNSTFDDFLRESLKKDSSNVYSLFTLGKLRISALKFESGSVLLDRVFTFIPHSKKINKLRRLTKRNLYNPEKPVDLTIKEIIYMDEEYYVDRNDHSYSTKTSEPNFDKVYEFPPDSID